MRYDLQEFERFYNAYVALCRIEKINRSQYHSQYLQELIMRVEEMKEAIGLGNVEYPLLTSLH